MNMGCCDCNGYHEFNLDWFLSTFKKLMAEWKHTSEEWTDFKDFAKNYFSDLPTYVYDKLEEMLQNGDFDFIKNLALETPVLFSMMTYQSGEEHYSLCYSLDGVSWSRIPGFTDFIDGLNLRKAGTTWYPFKYGDYYCWTSTQNEIDDNSSDIGLVTTKDFKNFQSLTTNLGFANLDDIAYVWTPQIFSIGDKWYCAATCGTNNNTDKGDYYKYGLLREASIYCVEIEFTPEPLSITPIGEIFKINLPYDGDYAIDGWFVEKDNRVYCLYSDRNRQTIVSAVSNDIRAEFSTLNTNVFNYLYIEAPTVFYNGVDYTITSSVYNYWAQQHEYNIVCHTTDFTNFYNYGFMGFADSNPYMRDVDGKLLRIKNPALFTIDSDIAKALVSNMLLPKHFTPDFPAYTISVTSDMAELFKNGVMSLLPNVALNLVEDVDLSGFNTGRIYSHDFIIDIVSYNRNTLTFNGISLPFNNSHKKYGISYGGHLFNAINNNTRYAGDWVTAPNWSIWEILSPFNSALVFVYEGTGTATKLIKICDDLFSHTSVTAYPMRINHPMQVYYSSELGGNGLIDINTDGTVYYRGEGLNVTSGNNVYGTCIIPFMT